MLMCKCESVARVSDPNLLPGLPLHSEFQPSDSGCQNTRLLFRNRSNQSKRLQLISIFKDQVTCVPPLPAKKYSKDGRCDVCSCK